MSFKKLKIVRIPRSSDLHMAHKYVWATLFLSSFVTKQWQDIFLLYGSVQMNSLIIWNHSVTIKKINTEFTNGCLHFGLKS